VPVYLDPKTRSWNSLIQQYLFALGEFEVDNYSPDYEPQPNEKLLWILFFIVTFFSQITILNMLIAIMGDTFDNVFENKKQYAMKEKLNILNDFVLILGIENAEDEDKYIYVAEPKQKGESENSWEGKVGAIKNGVLKCLNEQKTQFTKKIAIVENEIISSRQKINTLAEMMTTLQNSNQDQLARMNNLNETMKPGYKEKKPMIDMLGVKVAKSKKDAEEIAEKPEEEKGKKSKTEKAK